MKTLEEYQNLLEERFEEKDFIKSQLNWTANISLLEEIEEEIKMYRKFINILKDHRKKKLNI